MNRWEVERNYLKARKWIIEKGFNAPNFISFSVPDYELILLDKISDYFLTPEAPVTEGIYSIYEEATKGIQFGYTPEFVISGDPALGFKNRRAEGFTTTEHQAIWVHALFHIYQNTETALKKNMAIVARMNEIDRTIRFGLDAMKREYKAEKIWETQRWQDYVAILNLLASSGIDKVYKNPAKSRSDLHDLVQMYDLMVEKYNLAKEIPINGIFKEGTATDMHVMFLEEHMKATSGSIAAPIELEGLNLSNSAPKYYLGFRISREIREKNESAWLQIVNECETDHDFLKRAEKYVNLDELVQETDEIFRKGIEGKPLVSALREARLNMFKEYYEKVRNGLKKMGDSYTPRLELLHLDTNLAVIALNDYYLRDQELLVLSKYLNVTQDAPYFPNVIAVRRGGLGYVVGMKQATAKGDIKTPYDLSSDISSWTTHFQVPGELEQTEKAPTSELSKELEGKLTNQEIYTVEKAIQWIKKDKN